MFNSVECSIQNPDSLPKNFALLKVVQRTLESEADKDKKIVVIKYEQEKNSFVASMKEDKSLARFLTTSNPKKDEVTVAPNLSSQKSIPQIKVPNPPTLSIEVCSNHGRPLELICVDDKHRVCAQCALFGTHRGHDVRQEEDVAKEIQLKVEVLMDMYQAMHQQCIDMQQSQAYERHYTLFKKR